MIVPSYHPILLPLDIFNEFTRDERHSVLISRHIVSDLEKIAPGNDERRRKSRKVEFSVSGVKSAYRLIGGLHLEGLHLIGELEAAKRAARALGMELAGIDADGVHVGQSDIQGRDLRRLMGPDKILGISAGTAEEAIAAEQVCISLHGFQHPLNPVAFSVTVAENAKFHFEFLS